jgi:hypothetical protein
MTTEQLTSELLQLEEAVQKSESHGMHARWEFGRALLTHRVGKKLPKGLLEALRQAVRVSRQEIQARMKFAERYPDDEAFSNAVGQYPSWHTMVRDGLTVNRRSTSAPTTKGDRVCDKILAMLAELNPDDIRDTTEFHDRLVEHAERFMATRERMVA